MAYSAHKQPLAYILKSKEKLKTEQRPNLTLLFLSFPSLFVPKAIQTFANKFHFQICCSHHKKWTALQLNNEYAKVQFISVYQKHTVSHDRYAWLEIEYLVKRITESTHNP